MIYNQGFKNIFEDNIFLFEEGIPAGVTKMQWRGSYLSYGISLYYPISNFWKKKSK